ncbi:SDR family NAD(P)-dependent oxidoreductase [Saccharothrix longispora]|uniref:Acyl transferase domain-containing protein/NAD(P)-dependent dehydrogenase (Short-subunit alcohol dehydrogenase family)/acyl carrier protein n=1 Tax=Saccharothrix longispora TaxID=33920 RepID=A0ABU1PV44_9PSEU|nr:SDR family NAD(P)-dependent oxidoreductase [Saccharothrix longispora]MDR6594495.1 acyl transferase domain-containing protein/NAD(P)-dependent dehydrogenase (short-subunit alcohol dehydrogenase family)/acyl carrier protein [Saccharothrix longispora]
MTHVRAVLADHPVAIVGMAGVFPGARDVQEFWTNVTRGVDCITEVPETHWRSADHYDPDPNAEDKTYCRRGGFLPSLRFDPVEFGMPPATIESTGVVQLVSLLVARDVLRDAGCDRDWFDPARTGVVLGYSGAPSIAQMLVPRLHLPVLRAVLRQSGVDEQRSTEIAERFRDFYLPWSEDSFPGMLGNVIAGRVANRMNLGGMNCTVDAACASSLAAVRMAVTELVEHRADLMITGGCDADNSITSFVSFCRTPALSRSETVRPFDARADGTLIGEGVGMLALKRLDDAVAHGDRVYAVIRGIGSASDGGATSIYAPKHDGQATTLRRAYADADCSPATVGLFEAHGTGTPVGDEVELQALATVLTEAGAEPRRVALGTVKSQIGHLKGAAGAAGLIKAALALHHKVLPPTINVDTPTESLTRDDAPCYLNTTTRPWAQDARGPKRAGVSAFGFGGTNFHVVLEEHGEPPLTTGHRGATAHLWACADPALLRFEVAGGAEWDDTQAVPETHARVGFVAVDPRDFDELRSLTLDLLDARADEQEWNHLRGVHYRRRALPGRPKIAALFAGQGSQYVGMGLWQILGVPSVRQSFDTACRFTPDLADVVFPPPGAGDAEAVLRRTEHAQPAIGALSAGQYRFLRDCGLRPDGVLGHSFGELTALWAAGSLVDDDFHRLARARGAAMRPPATSTADPGAMVAVTATAATVEEMIRTEPDLLICNHNAPDQVVVGGATAAVERFARSCGAASVVAVRLPVACAFHTPHVDHAVPVFADAVQGVELRPPATPVYSNVAGAEYGADVEANRRLLVEQLRRPVDFAGRVRQLYREGFRVFVEFGPKQILTHLVRRTLDADDVVAVHTDGGPGRDDMQLKSAALRLAVLGLSVRGINRHAPRATPTKPPSAASVVLRGTWYLSEERRQAQNDLLEAPRPDPIQVPHPLPTAEPAPAHDDWARVAAEHVALHQRYLDGQLQVAEHLVRHVERPDLAAGVAAVAQHSIAMGQAHIRANEVLSTLLGPAGADPGLAPTPSPTPIAPPVLEPPRPAPDCPVTLPALAPPPAPAPAQAPRPMSIEDVDPDELRETLLRVVADKTGYHVDMLEPDLDLQTDLGIDSLKRAEILSELWKRYPVRSLDGMGIQQFVEIRTLNDTVELLVGLRGQLFGEDADDADVVRSEVRLVPLPEMDVVESAYHHEPRAVLVDDRGDLCRALAAALTVRGWRVHALPHADWTEDSLAAALDAVLAEAGRVDLVVAPDASVDETAPDAVRRHAHALLTAKRLLDPLCATAATGARAAFLAVSLGRGVPTSALGGLAKTLAHEAPQLFCRSVVLSAELSAERAAQAALRELDDAATDVNEVFHDGVDRRVARLVPLPSTPAPHPALDRDDVVVVTGGARGITSSCVVALAHRAPCHFVLLGRTGREDEPAWVTGVPTDGLPAALLDHLRGTGKVLPPAKFEALVAAARARREVEDTLAALAGAGATAEYVAVDVTDRDAVIAALAPHAGRVTALVHGAAEINDGPLRGKGLADVERVLAAKVVGLHNVLGALDPLRLRHLVLFASVVGLIGNTGQADYAVANGVANRFAHDWQAAHPRCRVVAINWGPWRGGMITETLRAGLEMAGTRVMSKEAGSARFVEEVFADRGTGSPVVVVSTPIALPAPSAPLPPTGRRVVRRLDHLVAEPVLRDHTIDEYPVLPLTGAVGWCANVLEHLQPGEHVVECRDFAVHKGLVFDGDERSAFTAEVLPAEGGALRVTITSVGPDDRRTPRYAGTFVTSRRVSRDQERGRAWHEELAAPPTPRPEYFDVLFCGPTLRGLRRVLAEDDSGMVLECAVPDTDLAAGAFAGRLHSTVLADQLVQAAGLFVVKRHDSVCLPVGVATWRMSDRLPAEEPFVIEVRSPGEDGLEVRVDVTASAADGRVLQRVSGLKMLRMPHPSTWRPAAGVVR